MKVDKDDVLSWHNTKLIKGEKENNVDKGLLTILPPLYSVKTYQLCV